MQVRRSRSGHGIAALSIGAFVPHHVEHVLKRRIALLADLSDNFLDGFFFGFGLDAIPDLNLKASLAARAWSSAPSRHVSNLSLNKLKSALTV